MRSLDCEGLGTAFAGALGSALGDGLETGAGRIELASDLPFDIERAVGVELGARAFWLSLELPSVIGERGKLLRSLDCEGLDTMFKGALGLALGTRILAV